MTLCRLMTCVVSWSLVLVFFFFFQAEDGIRDLTVTGVQTCALPISHLGPDPARRPGAPRPASPGSPGRRDTEDPGARSEEHTSELQSQSNLVCRLLLEKKSIRKGSRNRCRHIATNTCNHFRVGSHSH